MRPSTVLPPPGRRARFALALALVAALATSLLGCAGPAAPPAGTTAPTVSDIVLASTTSTQDSGLFDVLIPAFEKAEPGYRVKVIAVGSGEALKLGEKKDADVLLVHSPAAEKEFVAAGFGTGRASVMYNDFLIVGPPADPAGVKRAGTAAKAFAAIAGAASPFISRGDDSGTHKKELSVWASATVDPKGAAWYVSTGQGMGETLKVAHEKLGYTIVDRATWLTNADKNPDLTVLLEGDKKLFNPYSVILIPGAKNPTGAAAFAAWITGADGQRVIGEFGAKEYGQQIFVPDAGK